MPRKKVYPTPRLKKLDMSKAKEHEHPDIDSKKIYLCLIGKNYFVGTFHRVWFGWSFNGWYNNFQFDAPGSNSSRWKQIWELKKPVKKKVVKK